MEKSLLDVTSRSVPHYTHNNNIMYLLPARTLLKIIIDLYQYQYNIIVVCIINFENCVELKTAYIFKRKHYCRLYIIRLTCTISREKLLR